MNFSPQIWTCDLRSWGDLMGHPQEASGLWTRIPWPSELVCTFQMPVHDQHFNQETTTRQGSSWPLYAQRTAGSPPHLALTSTACDWEALLHFRKWPHWILDPSSCSQAPSCSQSKIKGNYFPLNFQKLPRAEMMEIFSYRNGQIASNFYL